MRCSSTPSSVPERLQAQGIATDLARIDRNRRYAGRYRSADGHLPINKPFAIDDPDGFKLPLNVITRSPWDLFYQNQMQINGGKNDGFVAWGDSGALVMGHYEGSKLRMWSIASRYVPTDNFFMDAIGGSYLNHLWLICACVPKYPNADRSPAKGELSVVEAEGVRLELAPNSPKSVMDGPPKFVKDGNLAPDFSRIFKRVLNGSTWSSS